MTDGEFITVQQFVKERIGVDLSQKRSLIEGRLEPHLARKGFHDFTEYMSYIHQDVSGKEMEEMLSILTTHHTYFWREPVHFDLYRNEVLPYLKRTEADSKDLRIWSAASSTGEEPYTLAMLNMDFFGFEHDAWDTKILATDVSTKVLEFAQKGIYSEEQVDALPSQWKRLYFQRQAEGKYEAKRELKEQVLFRQFNLMNPLPFRKPLHVVFIRNVMIYFEEDTKRQLLERIVKAMMPGGYLFVGTTESVDREYFGLDYVIPSVYRKNEKAGRGKL